HDHLIDAHRLDCQCGVNECLPFGDAAPGSCEVDCVGTQSLGRQTEAGSRAGGRLEEEVCDDCPGEQVRFRLAALSHLLELCGSIENGIDFACRKLFERQQMTSRPDAGTCDSCHSSTLSSVKSGRL